jgi:hypothetical protein
MEYIELLEVLFVEMDPLEEGFSGALVEVHRHDDRYVLLGIAPSTGNQLVRFSSKDKKQVYAGDLSNKAALGFFPPQPPFRIAGERNHALF